MAFSQHCWIILAIVLLSTTLSPSRVTAEEVATESVTPPNIVFLLVDDLGWADLGYNGSRFHKTPNINALAESGMRFNQGYAACPVCSPTRASILTGRHPVRVDITDWIPGATNRHVANPRFGVLQDRDNLALEETTIAETLRGAGYQTFFAGKWHLGDTGHLPTDQGFDINIGGMHRGSPPGGYYAPYKNPQLKSKNDGEYLTQRLTDESVRFMQSRDVERPFLMYLSYYNVHTPITAYKKRIQEYRDRAQAMFKTSTPIAPEKGGGNDAAQSRMRQDDPRYGSMVAAVDDSVGQLMRCLEDLGIQDNTVVCFFSDNGGLCTLGKNRKGPTCNLPLRSGKGWLYEGGIREPFIIRAPGVTTAGTQCNTPVQSVDFYPTLLQLAGLPLQPRLHADGRSLVSLLRGKSDPDASTRALYWHYPHYHGSQWCPGAAIRDGDWKLIRFYETDIDELYNLRTDPGEQQNVAEANPAIRDALIEKLKGWQKEIGARMPPRL